MCTRLCEDMLVSLSISLCRRKVQGIREIILPSLSTSLLIWICQANLTSIYTPRFPILSGVINDSPEGRQYSC